MMYVTDADVEALRDALYDRKTGIGWLGKDECDEMARIVAPAVEKIAARAASEHSTALKAAQFEAWERATEARSDNLGRRRGSWRDVAKWLQELTGEDR